MPFRRGHHIGEFMGRNRELYLASKKRYYEKHKERHLQKGWIKRIRQRFGLTEDRYYEILDAQNRVCAICRGPEKKTRDGRVQRLCVDHCHETGEVRGLLCHSCNVALGLLRDNPELIRQAAEYVERQK